MNVLFYLEPAIELGNPEFRYATLRSSIVPQVSALRDAGVNVHCIVSQVIAERALRDGHIDAIGSLSTIDPLDWTEGENTLERSLRHQAKNHKDGELARLGELLKSGIPQGFDPDIIIVWESPMSLLGEIFPKARIIYQMPGFFSRAPFANLVAFDTGLLGDSTSPANRSVSPAEIEALESLRDHEARFLSSIAPTQVAINDLKQRFRSVILLPLQIDGYFMIDSVLGRRSQFDVLVDIMGRIPDNQALVVTNYWSGQTRSAVLTEQNITYLRSRFANFAYFENFDKIPSVSQLLVPEMDGVITISSSLGYQAAFWQKPLLTLGTSHITPFATTNDWNEFFAQVIAGEPIVRDELIISSICTKHLPVQMLENGKGYAGWLQEVATRPAGDFPRWTDNEPVAKTLLDLRREPEYLKQLGYFNLVHEESSMDHCRELSQQIQRHPIISFDVFDTLLYRPFKSPSDMFEFMSDEVRQICNLPSLDFRAARRAAEKAAFEEAIARGDGETRIDEIYKAFAEQTGVGQERAERVQQLEMQMEMDILYPRLSGFKAFNEARSLGKRIIIISDMYLPRDFLEAILKKNGYEGYERFYVSSEARVKKHNGRLFDHVLEDLNVDPKTILHVGDNVAADVVRAKERGIKPFHLIKASEVFAKCDSFMTPWSRDEERHSLDWKMILAVAGNRFHDNPYLPHRRGTLFCGDPWRLGYYGQGPMLLGYTKWLMEKAIRDGVKRLYFLSRDGLIMKEAYDRIAQNYPDAPSSHYLLCSRRAVNLAKVRDEHGVMDLLQVDYARTTIQHLLSSRFGVYPANVPTELLAKHNLTLETIVTNKHQEMLKPFFLDLLPLIVTAASKERANYLEYLEGTGLLDSGEVALVDIGYAGTMQESLYLLTDRKKLFGGYYLMTFRQALKRVDAYGMPIRGYLGEFVDRHDTHHPFCRNVPLYETLFSSVDTSFVRMDRDWNGRLTPIFMDRFAAEAKREEVVHRIHKGALSFIEETARIFGSRLKNLDIEPVKSLRVLEKFFSDPHPVDAKMFAGLVFEDAYGGAGLKKILPTEDKLEEQCVWKMGAAALQRAQSENGQPNATETTVTNTPARTHPTKAASKLEQRLIRWVVRKTSNDRKFKKFELTPVKFFNDSKSPHVRLLGRLYLSRSAD
ncbi:HAD family hydrolase [Pseudomonas silensiensis]|uniref:HAD family hydrolase n=1 Tax=Pseudomonas silensiensis TaxID=2991049 RepID=UPI003D1C80AA